MCLKKIIANFLEQPINYKGYAILRTILALALLLTVSFNDYNIIYLNDEISIIGNLKINLFWSKFITICVLIWTISGYYPIVNGFLQFIVTFFFFKTCPFVDGGDQLATNITLLLIPLTLLDKNRTHWKNLDNSFNGIYSKPAFLFTSLLICIQIAIVYLHSSIGKLNVKEWVNGTALWYWVTHETFGASYFILDALKYCLKFPFIIYTLNWFVITLELLITLMLFVPKDKFLPRLIFLLGVLLHIGILLVHGIFTFSIVMIGCLIFYFQFNLRKSGI